MGCGNLMRSDLNPKTAGVVYLTTPPPPSFGFLKIVSSKERVKLWFFVTFKIIIRQIFSENFIQIRQVVQKLWRTSLSILAIFIFHQFLSFFRIFGHFLVTKKLMASAYNR